MKRSTLRLPSPLPPLLAGSRHLLVLALVSLAAQAPAYPGAEGLNASAPADAEECTIAVLAGPATPDGRPILWKNRDAASINNEISYFTDRTFR